jgi:hypothetical protein
VGAYTILKQPDRSRPTEGLNSGGAGGCAGSELGPALLGMTCVKCGKRINQRGTDGLHGYVIGPRGPLHREKCP